MGELKRKVVTGVAWSMLTRLCVQGSTFLISLVLSRLLTPHDYGAVAVLTILLTIMAVVVDSGFGVALIRRQNLTDTDISTAFWISLSISLCAYVVLCCCSPLVADFFDIPLLAPLLCLQALTLVFHAYSGIQTAVLRRSMRFDVEFRVGLVSFGVGGVIGILFAWLGWGAWALVLSSHCGVLAGILARQHYLDWRPRATFSRSSASSLFGFGGRIFFSHIISVCYDNAYGIVVGKLYSVADLAFVNKGRSTPQMMMDAINGTLMNVTYPALSRLQGNQGELMAAGRRMIRCSTFLVFPMMMGLAVCADALIPLLFGDQWVHAVPFMQMACFEFALWPFHTINLQAIMAIGRSDVYLKLEVFKKGIGVTLLCVSAPMGVWWMIALVAFVGGPLGVIVNAWPNRKLLGYSLTQQLLDVAPSGLLCFLMGGATYALGLLPMAIGLLLPLQVVLGACLYMGLAWLFRLEALREFVRMYDALPRNRVPAPVNVILNRILARLR